MSMRGLRLTILGYLVVVLAFIAGCHDRIVGQVELFDIQSGNRTLHYPGTQPAGGRGQYIQPGDWFMVRVDAAYLQSLPPRLTGSRDVILFAEAQPDASVGYAGARTTTIIYCGPNQRIPGRLNFTGNLALGPTRYTGHPLKIKFTLMVLQGAEQRRDQSAVDVVAKLASVATPQYSELNSILAGVIHDILAAQPDISVFDYEVTLPADTWVSRASTNGQSPTALRADQLVLLETRSWRAGADETLAPIQTGDICFDGDLLRRKSTGKALTANYLVFHIQRLNEKP